MPGKKQSLLTRLLAPVIKTSLYDLHPELANRVPILRISSDDEQQATPNGFRQAANSYSSHMWVRKAVDILSNNIAPLPLQVISGTGKDKKVLDNHIIKVLLDNPNPEMGTPDLWRQWVIDQMLGGEFGLEVVSGLRGRKVVELWPRQPQTFSIRPLSVRYRQVAYYKIDDGNGEPYNLTPEQFIHIKFYNPLLPFRGISPISAVQLSIAIDQLAQIWTRLFFSNQARPDYAVIAPEGITQSERTELENELARKFGGDGSHKPIILEEGITDIKVFSWAPKDLEWVNQRQMSRDEIGAVFGVPDEIMGYGRDTYENFGTAEKVLWTLTITPLCGLRDGTLTRFFRKIGMLGANEKIETDFSNVSQLQEDISGKILQLKDLFSMGVPFNTGKDFLGLAIPNIEGGDVGYLPMGLLPIGTDRTPAPLPTANTEPEPETDNQDVNNPEKAIKKSILDFGSAEHEIVYKRLQARLDPFVEILQRIAKREFQRQQNEVSQKLRASKEYGRGKFVKDVIPLPSNLFDSAEEVRKFIEAFTDETFEAVERIGNAELSALGVQGVFDITRPEVQASIKQILKIVAEKTTNTTWEGLVDLFQEAEIAGEGIPAIMERLSTFFGDRKSDYQTERIARTTMTGASNDGNIEAWRQSQVVRGKTWISALQPDRSREEHMAAHGQTVALDEMFTVGGEPLAYPGDPTGSPENIINCLCTLIPVVKE